MLLSVITVVYNDVAGLKQTIMSVVNQTFTDFEYIIIDGGSNDGSVDVINEYKSSINYWVSESDNGVYSAMNKGLEKATGKYCIFMNAGDTFCNNNVLEESASQLNFHDLIVGNACMIRAGKVMSVVKAPEKITYGFLLYHSIVHQAAFMRVDKLKDRLYDESLKIVSDWKYMLLEYLTGEYRYKPINLNVCNFDTSGISSDNDRRMDERDKVLKEVLPPMLYSEYKDFNGLKNLYTNVPFMITLNEILKFRSLVAFLTMFNDLLLKTYRLFKK